MPGHEETNVRLPPCAFDALAVVAARRGVSRDEAVRQVLGEHVEVQENREPEDRLTHVSTVLRYPPPPRWRGEPRADRPLRLRLVPGMIPRARAVSLRLPGQSPRAHRDYQTRLLTDAVMTAIAVQQPFADEFLEGLLPLLRHRAAVGLWQLAVAATSTRPEDIICNAAEEARSQGGGPGTPPNAEGSVARHRLLLVAEALEEEVAWHSPARYQVAANIARDMLSGADADANERLLYEQRAEWHELRLDLRGGIAARARYLRGALANDWTGRGGSAAWRAERRVVVQDFEEWLTKCSGHDPGERHVWPPGWLVRAPSTWHAHELSAATTRMPEPYATWVAVGRLLAFPVEHMQVLWPLIRSPGRPGWAPVPDIEPMLAAAAGLRPDQVSGFIEAMLVDWSGEDGECEEPAFPLRLQLPVDRAFRLGFIGADERRHAMAQARGATLQAMTDIIRGLPEHERHHRSALERAWGNDRLFGRRAGRLGIRFRVAKAMWDWRGRSVADEILTGTPADALQWLAYWAHKTCTRILQQSMEGAWWAAFDHRPSAYWPPTAPVTPTTTEFAPLSFEMDPGPPF